MKRLAELFVVLAIVALVAVALRPVSEREGSEPKAQVTTPATPEPSARADGPLVPLEAGSAPELTESSRVTIQTGDGEITLELYPEAAPNAYKRFMTLVDEGFYDNTVVSRVVPDFVVQFGVNPRMAEWKDNNFDDDPSHFQHLPGTIAFAKAGPNTNSTQVFINLNENNRLADPGMGFTVFGKVVDGMDVVEGFKVVGKPSMGLDQAKLWSDPSYPETIDSPPVKIVGIDRIKDF